MKKGNPVTPITLQPDQLSAEIRAASEFLGIPATRSKVLADLVIERAKHQHPTTPDTDRSARAARIRTDYNGSNGAEIAKREGISERQVRRIANGA